MKKQILFLVIIIAVMGVVSGCIAKKKQRSIVQEKSEVGSINQEITNEKDDEGYSILDGDNNRKIFRSKKCGFEISYPNYFSEIDYCNDNLKTFAISDMKNSFLENDEIYFQIEITDKKDDLKNYVLNLYSDKKNLEEKYGKNDVQIVSGGDDDKKEEYEVIIKYGNPSDGDYGMYVIYFLNYKNSDVTYIVNSKIANQSDEGLRKTKEIFDSFSLLK